ncbi:MAG: DUF2892 domain-containing protein [Cytophagaceae bacterium]|nr:DUF2892 domain-containing protein [Cytophagaceae bacterium]
MLLCNVGPTDRKIRIITGVILLGTLFALETWFFLLAWIPIATGVLELCPLYYVLGINTTPAPKKWWPENPYSH